MKINTNDLKQWLQAEKIEEKENGVYIKFDKINEAEFDFICEEYTCKRLSDNELLMPTEEFEILINVYESSKIKWN